MNRKRIEDAAKLLRDASIIVKKKKTILRNARAASKRQREGKIEQKEEEKKKDGLSDSSLSLQNAPSNGAKTDENDKIVKKMRPEYKEEEEKEKEEDIQESVTDARVTVRASVQGRNTNERSFLTTISLPNACAICSEIFTRDLIRQDDDNDNVDVVQPLQRLDLICDGDAHSHMPENPAERERVFNEILRSNQHGDFVATRYRRYCLDCFRIAIRAQVEKTGAFLQHRDRDGLSTFQLTCPFCWPAAKNPLDTDRVLSLVDPETSRLVQTALDREYVETSYPTFRCFVQGCTHIEIRESLADERGTVKPIVQFIHCPRHGTQCTKCWEVVDNDDDVKKIHLSEECRGLPKELRNVSDATGIRRCPHCQMPIQRSIGCDNMTCSSCKKNFNWASAPKLEPVIAVAAASSSATTTSNLLPTPNLSVIRGTTQIATAQPNFAAILTSGGFEILNRNRDSGNSTSSLIRRIADANKNDDGNFAGMPDLLEVCKFCRRAMVQTASGLSCDCFLSKK